MQEYFEDDEIIAKSLRRRQQKLDRKKRRAQRRRNRMNTEYNTHADDGSINTKTYNLKYVEPKTDSQHEVFKAFFEDKNLLLHGVAGTGKTFLALYLALDAVINNEMPKPIVILRSIVPARDGGFLPGKIEEKAAIYEIPYYGLCAELTGHKTAYEKMKREGLIEFSTTSYLRGLTFHNNVIIVDECQNMSFSELDTIMTRVGEGCRVIFCGDFRQSDLIRDDERKGLHKFMGIVKKMKSFESIEFTEQDILRSGLVKEYIMARDVHA